MRLFTTYVLAAALGWLFLFGQAPAAFGQRKRKEGELAPAPPPVVAQKVTVTAGERIAIPLGIHGRRSEQLEFLLRSRPRAGKVSPITTTGANSASITYQAPLEPQEDRFTYAVQGRDGVSAPGVIVIQVLARPVLPARLTAPDSVTFPEIVLGQRSSATLEIRNEGGSPIEGELQVPEPWSIEGVAAYRLSPGATATFKIAFRPTKAGTQSGDAILGPVPRRVVALIGEVQTPLVVAPERLALMAGKDGKRSATMTFENRSDDALRVAIATGSRLRVDPNLEVPARGSAQLVVIADPAEPKGFIEKLTLTAGDWSQEVPVDVAALGPMVKLATESPARDAVKVGDAWEWPVSVQNSGGRATLLTLKVDAPFRVSDEKLTVGAGARMVVRVSCGNVPAGEHVVALVAQAEGVNERIETKLKATSPVVAPTMKPSPSAGAVKVEPRVDTASGEREEIRSGRVRWSRPAGREDHPGGMGEFVKEAKPKRAILEWPASLSQGAELSAEERKVMMNAQGELEVNWYPLPGVTFQTASDPMRAELGQLEPERVYTVRIRQPEATIFTVQFATPPEPPLLPFGWRGALIGLLVAIAAFLGWRQWKQRTRSSW